MIVPAHRPLLRHKSFILCRDRLRNVMELQPKDSAQLFKQSGKQVAYTRTTIWVDSGSICTEPTPRYWTSRSKSGTDSRALGDSPYGLAPFFLHCFLQNVERGSRFGAVPKLVLAALHARSGIFSAVRRPNMHPVPEGQSEM